MARTKGPQKNVRAATARACLTKAEYASLGRHARVKGTTVSNFMRQAVLAAIAADVGMGVQQC
jgi:hypothetical protein